MSTAAALLMVLLVLSAPAFAQPMTTCRPNIFGGQDCDTPAGPLTSQPNIFGGQDYRLPDGRHVTSEPNIFGGYDYRGDDAVAPAPTLHEDHRKSRHDR